MPHRGGRLTNGPAGGHCPCPCRAPGNAVGGSRATKLGWLASSIAPSVSSGGRHNGGAARVGEGADRQHGMGRAGRGVRMPAWRDPGRCWSQQAQIDGNRCLTGAITERDREQGRSGPPGPTAGGRECASPGTPTVCPRSGCQGHAQFGELCRCWSRLCSHRQAPAARPPPPPSPRALYLCTPGRWATAAPAAPTFSLLWCTPASVDSVASCGQRRLWAFGSTKHPPFDFLNLT